MTSNKEEAAWILEGDKKDFKFNQDEKDEQHFNYYLIIYVVIAFFIFDSL